MPDPARRPDVVTEHSRHIDAPPELVWRGLTGLDLRDSLVVRLLLAVRGLSKRSPLTLAALADGGFRPLRSRAPTPADPTGELVLGLVAQPWRLTGGIRRGDVGDLDTFDEPGHAVISWSYLVDPTRGGCRLTTRTTVRCTDDVSRRRFMRYWRIVGPFSGLIRRESLRLVARRVEPIRDSG